MLYDYVDQIPLSTYLLVISFDNEQVPIFFIMQFQSVSVVSTCSSLTNHALKIPSSWCDLDWCNLPLLYIDEIREFSLPNY